MSQAEVISAVAVPPPVVSIKLRVRAAGKFLFVDHEKFYPKGVTYGTFRPDAEGLQYPDRARVEEDFALMVERGFNTVRVYTPPPRWLLDTAARLGLYVMVGLSWEQHVAFLDEPGRADSIEERIRETVRSYAGHQAVMCYTLGNETPAAIVRWHGRHRVEAFLRRLYRAVKAEDPECLVTYVNFPTTEYLELPFLDLFCFNVYLESRERLESYLARLQNLAGERPLLMAELGLDSRRNGEIQQAETLSWQIETAFASGCAGVLVFAWTDEWHRGGHDIENWDFGLVRRDRTPKRALQAVAHGFARAPFPADLKWPRVSVVVCTYNGRRTIRDTLEGLQRLAYPDYEVIVVSDGSSDGCVALAHGYGLRVIAGPNRGLSEARNIGFRAATGPIVAYIDDDAHPDPHWLHYVAYAFMTTRHAAVGGPNVAPPDSGWVADCVANAPGGANHVLVSDLEAEHIPGCNMAYRKACLEEVGGFDAQFRIAGDDVDLCWRLLDRGWTIGFSPAAMVWHHRRNSIKAYWRQQKNYGKAEGMLERRWPRRFSSAGHPSWAGRVYGKGHTVGVHKWRSRIYQGIWGSAPFQPLYEPPASVWEHLPLMPEWYLVNVALAAIMLLGVLWTPLFFAAPVLALTAGLPLLQALRSALAAQSPTKLSSAWHKVRFRAVTACLHMLQPLSRLLGRLSFGLAPWRVHSTGRLAWPSRRRARLWSETWQPSEKRLEALHEILGDLGAQVDVGGEFDRWDLQIRGGLAGSVRALIAAEDHAGGRQMVWVELRRSASPIVYVLAGTFAVLSGAAVLSGTGVVAAGALGAIAAAIVVRLSLEQAAAIGTAIRAMSRWAERQGLVHVPLKARKTAA
jgi:GT2 family glycosyltransferase